MIPTNETATQFLRDVRQILRGTEVGIRWVDNVGPVATLEYVDADAPFDVRVDLKEAPLAVVWVRAQDITTPANGIDGLVRVRWSWVNGMLRIHDIDVTNTSNRYAVTLGLLKG